MRLLKVSITLASAVCLFVLLVTEHGMSRLRRGGDGGASVV